MAADEIRLTESLSQNILTLLCFSEGNGALAAMLITAEEFAEPYNEIAARALQYREEYGEPPGKAHTADLFDEQLRDPKSDRGQIFLRILQSLFKLSETINEKYAIDRLGEFSRVQNYKRSLMSSLERIKQAGDGTANDLEQIFTSAISFTPQPADTGFSLSDFERSLAFLDKSENDANQLKLNIDMFDKMGIVPTRQELFGFLAPRGRGKSMFCTHVASQALRAHWRVLYVSNELSEEKISQRLFQNLFSIAKRPDVFSQTRLTFNEIGELLGFSTNEVTPSMSINNPSARDYIRRKMDNLDTNLGFIRIKRFPSGQLTIPKLNSYLDYLDRVEGFRPDCLIEDYPGISKIDPANFRLELGQHIVDLRGIAVERNMAVVTPHQSTRSGEDAALLTAKHAAEDISLFATADNVLTYNATPMERKLGTARLHAAKVRDDRSDITVVITQAYEISQFVVNSGMMNRKYRERLESLGAQINGENE